ncbi:MULTISPECIES: hypothetical protein [Sinorhizobium]|uniref:hypothetical protein n=1 Tax=Sinorhizobium TaxID=28105 RepID=UPI0004629B2F|nr:MULTISPECIES: hypothetical protein [Sinorhizobium]MDX0467453.1 hypothetical protein [Sinorhizobium medicae]MDX0631867.1 hypothetical protein [Sinorhizobium medicae]MDX0955641.1 hypothetical protein [Sinorhizobium medicae]MDX1174298.1 hypothetical protein [Sinorhizobium medicae]MDX1245246.1 hypothetical protein [Sinorhizobium medicae]
MALAVFINSIDEKPVAVNPNQVIAVMEQGRSTLIFTTADQSSVVHRLAVTDGLASVIDKLNAAQAVSYDG